MCLPCRLVLAAVLAAAPAAASAQASGSAAPRDSAAASRDSLMNEVLRSIAGREQEPAESVFRDIQIFRGMPAGRIPRLMNLGFGRSLGVGCEHCHVPGEWADSSKPTKQIAREMSRMVRVINEEQLARIPNLRSERPMVNCTTCHRGQTRPALNMEGP